VFIPLRCVKLLNQNTQSYTTLIISRGGSHLNGKDVPIAQTLSFTILMYMFMSLSYINSCICLNCPYPRMAHNLNLWYDKLVLLVQETYCWFCCSCLLLAWQYQNVCSMTWISQTIFIYEHHIECQFHVSISF